MMASASGRFFTAIFAALPPAPPKTLSEMTSLAVFCPSLIGCRVLTGSLVYGGRVGSTVGGKYVYGRWEVRSVGSTVGQQVVRQVVR